MATLKEKWRSSRARRMIKGFFAPSKKAVAGLLHRRTLRYLLDVERQVKPIFENISALEAAAGMLAIKHPELKINEELTGKHFDAIARASQAIQEISKISEGKIAKTSALLAARYSLDALNIIDPEKRKTVYSAFKKAIDRQEMRRQFGHQTIDFSSLALLDIQFTKALGGKTNLFFWIVSRKIKKINRIFEKEKTKLKKFVRAKK